MEEIEVRKFVKHRVRNKLERSSVYIYNRIHILFFGKIHILGLLFILHSICESNLITTLIYAKFEAHDPSYPTKLIINVIYISHLFTKDKLLIRFDLSYL